MTQVLKEIVADFRTSLSAKIAAGGTSGTIQNNLDDDGVALPAGKYCFTLDNDNSQKEHIACDLSGSALTSIVSISRQGVETSGTVREHRIGASVTITDFSHIFLHNELLKGDVGFDSLKPLKYDADPTLSLDAELATKKYVDDTAIGGGVDASTTLKGITKLSTAPASASAPIAVGDNDQRLPSQDENDALAGTSGTPSTTNKYVTDGDTAEDTASKVVRRKSDSNITVPTTPTADTDAASKVYVDGKLLTTEIVASTTVVSIANNTGTSSDDVYTKVKEIKYNGLAGTITVYFEGLTSNPVQPGRGQVYINGIAVGTERILNSTSFVAFSQDFSVSDGDLIQLYVKRASTETASYKNFRLLYEELIVPATDTVILN